MSRVIAPEDVDTVLRHPLTMMGTDTYALDGRLDPAMALHPRNHGAFARFLARYVRGRLAPGYAADVVVFDPARIADLATLADPYGAPEGIARVLVNGVEVARDGVATPALPGVVIKRS